MKIRHFLQTACAALVLTALTACTKITQENYNAISEGMTPNEVEAILGKPSNVDSSSALGVVSGTTYEYREGDKEIIITFLNDKVVSKSSDL